MIEDRLEAIRERLRQSAHLPEASRQELLTLLHALEAEIAALPDHHADDAQSITRFADASAHEATRTEQRPQVLATAVEGLRQSVEAFETTHPTLTATINRIALILSNMGI